jgi:flagellar motor switch protein FliG
MKLGKDAAAAVLAHMDADEVEAISAEIAELSVVDPDETRGVMDEFGDLLIARQHMLQGGIEYARELLRRSLGEARAEEALARLTAKAVQAPFLFLHRADPAQLRSFISDEHPQVIALVLAHMPPDKASLVLSELSPELQGEVAHRIAVMDRANPETVRVVETVLERRLSRSSTPATPRGWAASVRWSASSTARTAPPSARSSRASRPWTPSWPRRSAAGCSSSRTS